MSLEVQRDLLNKNAALLGIVAANAARFDLIASVLDDSLKDFFYSIVREKILSQKLVASTYCLIASHIAVHEIAILFEKNIRYISDSIFSVDSLDRVCSFLNTEQKEKLQQHAPKPYIENNDMLFFARHIPTKWRQILVPNSYHVPTVTISLTKVKTD